MASAYTRRNRANRRFQKRKPRYFGGADQSQPIVGVDKTTGQMLPGQESSLTGILPTTTWGYWANYPGSIMWSKDTQAPPPLANGGLYTGPQSTGPWASQPFPATQYAEMVEASRVAQNPDVFFHQRPNDNTGASFSPMVAVPLSNQHYSAEMPAPISYGGARKQRKQTKRTKRTARKQSRKHK